jgi:hypothetical protein
VRPIKAGDRDLVDGHEVLFTHDLAIGHKILMSDSKSFLKRLRAETRSPLPSATAV